MITDQHTVKTLADQFRNKIVNRNLSIHRSFFCMTMHIKFHLFCSFFLLWLTSLVHAKYNRFPHSIQRFYEKNVCLHRKPKAGTGLFTADACIFFCYSDKCLTLRYVRGRHRRSSVRILPDPVLPHLQYPAWYMPLRRGICWSYRRY